MTQVSNTPARSVTVDVRMLALVCALVLVLLPLQTGQASSMPRLIAGSTAHSNLTWTRQTLPVGIAVHGVACSTARFCVAVGWSGSILVSWDGGASWTLRLSGLKNSLLVLQ